jgi:DNA-binding NarL/FixJ family response regulator
MPNLPTLLIDDDPDQLELARTLLTRAGVGPIVQAMDAEAGLELAADPSIALILLDLGLPGRSGLDVLPDLVAAAPGASVVVVSNMSRRRYADKAVRLGALGFVEKRVPAHRFAAEVLAAAALSAAALSRVHMDLPAEGTSPRVARTLVRDMLNADDEMMVAAAELLITELVTNALVHASSAPRVEVELFLDHVRVAVQDDDPTPPTRREPARDRPGGRGLVLLEEMSTRWGVDPLEAGKVVWFELARAEAKA